mgnify:CR=1 FL=1
MTNLLNNASVLVFLLNKIPHVVVLCNKNYEIVLWNEYAVNMVGESVGTVDVGAWQQEHKFYTRDGKELSEEDRALFRAVKEKTETTSKTIVKINGSDKYIETTAYPIYDDNKNVIGGAAFFSDVTNRIKMEKTINEILAKLEEMQEYLRSFSI